MTDKYDILVFTNPLQRVAWTGPLEFFTFIQHFALPDRYDEGEHQPMDEKFDFQFMRTLLAVAFNILMPTTVVADTLTFHRETVDVSAYPWTAIGKVFNEAGGACTGVIISRDKILTAAHCIYSERTQRFLPPLSLHFLVGYRSGRSAAHARVSRYEIGAGYNPRLWKETMRADWVILTLTRNLPEGIEPLKMIQGPAPSGTRAIIAGYPLDRPHRMTADRNCQLGGDVGSLLFHTCRGVRGYSGAPILVISPDNEVRVAGIHIGATSRNGIKQMVAVPARSISWAATEPPLGIYKVVDAVTSSAASN